MGAQGRTVAEAIERIASRQHGLVTRHQLLSAGLTRRMIGRRVGQGSLLRIHRGVYRVGHRAPSIEARYMAAVLACGERALLACRAAAFLYGLVRGGPPPPEVIAATDRRIPGVLTRRCRDFDSVDPAHWRGIPITTVPRTLVDLAATLPLPALARACHEAGVLYDTNPRQVETVLGRRPTSPGASKLRQVLHGDVDVTLSKLESSFLALLRASSLPLPQMNRAVDGRRVDCHWPEHRLTVELDGYRYHRSRHAWEQDRRREREARSRGDEFRRFTWADIGEDSSYMLTELGRLLASNLTRAP
jgi:very-short-patch-repair endonuclease